MSEKDGSIECKSYDWPKKKTIWEMADWEFAEFMRNARTCEEVWERV